MNSTNETGGGVQGGPTPPLAAVGDRVSFWADTCREVTQMTFGSKHAIELYQKFGCRFWAPSVVQVEHVLKALDAALPQWETAHPELFYQTLELNFPELLKQRQFGPGLSAA